MPVTGFRASPVSYTEISVRCCRNRLSPFLPLSCGCLVPSITSSHNMEMARTERIHVSILFVYGVGFPCSGYRSRSLALFLMHRFSFSNPSAVRITACRISALPGNNMLHSPSGFPSQISCRMMSCRLLIWSLLLPIFAVGLILSSHRLLKAVFHCNRATEIYIAPAASGRTMLPTMVSALSL